MKIKSLISILLILFVFSLISCSTPKQVVKETAAITTVTAAITTIPETTAPPTTIAETTIIEESNIDSFDITGYDKLTITFKSCLESNIAVETGFENGDFTCTAKPGMKFEIIFFEYKNNGDPTVKLPGIGGLLDKDKNLIFCDDGSEYTIWSYGWAHLDEEYNRREATKQELDMYIGDNGLFELLSPGDAFTGSITFEVPIDSSPKSIVIQIDDNSYDIEIPEKFITQDANLQETTETVDFESTVRDVIKDYIENTLEGRLTKFDFSEDFTLLKISYNSRWSSEDTIKKEMFEIISIFSGSDYPDQYDIELTATGNTSGDSYKSVNSIEILLKLHDYKMDYPGWLEQTF